MTRESSLRVQDGQKNRHLRLFPYRKQNLKHTNVAELGVYIGAKRLTIMRLKKILCLAVFVLATNVHAQDLKILVDKKGKVGFADQNGNEVIKCQYDGVQPFSDGVAIVSKSGKSGIIDSKGTILLPLKYSQISKWNKELYIIKDGKKVGLATHQGKIVLPANYSQISKPNCYGKALLSLGGKSTANEKKTYMANAKYGIIDANGNIIIEPQYKGLYEFTYDGTNKYPYYEGKRLEFSYHNTVDTLVTDCAYLGYSNNGFSIYNAGIIDGSGKELLKQGLYDFVMQPQSGMVRYYINKKKQTICGYHNIVTGKGFVAATFDTHFNNISYWSHGDFIGDIAPVNGTSWSFIDKQGNKLRTGYTSLRHSQITGLWGAKNNTGKWDVFNDSNNDVSSLSGYEEILFPTKEGDREIFSVMKNGKYGCIDRSGNTVVPFDYEMMLGNTFDVIAVKKDGKWGILSPDNKSIIPTEYSDLLLPSERNAKHFWVKQSDSLYYHMNIEKAQLSYNGFKSVTNFTNGIAHVAPVGMVVEQTPINRAQLYAPGKFPTIQNDNTNKRNLASTVKQLTVDEEFSKNKESFGYILNTDDVLIMNIPVSTLYKDAVVKEIMNRGGKTLSANEQKAIMLDVTKENRSYDLKSVVGEEEWNY